MNTTKYTGTDFEYLKGFIENVSHIRIDEWCHIAYSITPDGYSEDWEVFEETDEYLNNKGEYDDKFKSFYLSIIKGVKDGKLVLSPVISDWYEKDFERGLKGYKSVKDFAAKNAKHLADKASDVELIKNKKLSVKSSKYSWKLNDAI